MRGRRKGMVGGGGGGRGRRRGGGGNEEHIIIGQSQRFQAHHRSRLPST